MSSAAMSETAGAPAVDQEQAYHRGGGVLSWILTMDHKRIGMMYLAAILFFFVVGGALALLIRAELITPAGDMFSAETYGKLFTLHGAVMIFLFVIPSVPASLGNFLLPLMLGAREVAFPRINLASFHLYLVGAVVLLYSMIIGTVDTGWTLYTGYSVQAKSAVIPATFGVLILGLSSVFSGLNFIVTTHKMRAPGMTWYRMPLFVWAIYSTSVIQILVTPVLAITLVLLSAERAFGLGIFDPGLGGDPVLFRHFFWFYAHPAVYIMVLPAFGIISELMSVHSRKRIFGYRAIAFSSVAIAMISFMVWGQHMFVSGQSELAAMIFSFLTFLVAIPVTIKLISWVATLYKGSIAFTTGMIYGLMFIILFSVGGLTGIFLATLSVNVHLHGTTFAVAHLHYVMMGGTVIAFLGGLHHWWPKMTGKVYSEKWGRIAAALVFVGFNLTFFSQFVMGSQGMPRRYHQYLEHFAFWQQLSTVGSQVLGIGLFTILFYMLHSLFRGRPATDNPWGGKSLEWSTATPPISHNFVATPRVSEGPYEFDEIDRSGERGAETDEEDRA